MHAERAISPGERFTTLKEPAAVLLECANRYENTANYLDELAVAYEQVDAAGVVARHPHLDPTILQERNSVAQAIEGARNVANNLRQASRGICEEYDYLRSV